MHRRRKALRVSWGTDRRERSGTNPIHPLEGEVAEAIMIGFLFDRSRVLRSVWRFASQRVWRVSSEPNRAKAWRERLGGDG